MNDIARPVQLLLIVPGLLAWPAETLAATRSLGMLAGFADAPRHEPLGAAAAMLAALGLGNDTPVAPLALLGAGSEPRGDYILCADPVHLVADRDTVVLVQRIDDLRADDAAALIGSLARHFADDDLRFEAVRPDAWFARRMQAPGIATPPLDAALHRSLRPHLPRGAAAGTWQRWQNEIEMLLHAHEVNAAREARGDPAVSDIWFWGGGRIGDVGALPATFVTAAPGRLGDLARGIARHGQGRAAASHAEEGATEAVARAGALAAQHAGRETFALAVLDAGASAARRLEADWLAPALDLLARRAIDRLHLVADGNGAAATWTAAAPGLWRRLAARARGYRFELPAGPAA